MALDDPLRLAREKTCEISFAGLSLGGETVNSSAHMTRRWNRSVSHSHIMLDG